LANFCISPKSRSHFTTLNSYCSDLNGPITRSRGQPRGLKIKNHDSIGIRHLVILAILVIVHLPAIIPTAEFNTWHDQDQPGIDKLPSHVPHLSVHSTQGPL